MIVRPHSAVIGFGAIAVATVALVLFFLMAIGVRYVWDLHPWISPGQNIHLFTQHLRGYECQAWQRKNTSLVEPFTTGLFIRKRGYQWFGFWIGFEDSYHPNVKLRQENNEIVVIFDGENIGAIDENLRAFRRTSDGSLFPPAIIEGDPPGTWWLQPFRKKALPQIDK